VDLSVKQLSEVLKIDPKVLLDKMIEAGLHQKNINDSVTTEDKQKLLEFIRNAKTSSAINTEIKPKTKVSKEPKRKPEPQEKIPVSSVKKQPPTKKSVNINGSIKVNDLSRKLSKRGNEIIKKLLELGVNATLNDEIDQETAVLVAEEFGFNVSFEEEQSTVEEVKEYPNIELTYLDQSKPKKRHAVVTVMGHVDHGKTSLLDAIKSTNVVDGESGGITQHIAAYEVQAKSGKLTFIDTPGHEAFTAMRARGAKTTDLVILVVAGNDSVKPQTIEAINHAKAASVPIIVALNKIDLEGVDLEKVKGDLAKEEIISEDWGGNVQMVPVSATTKKGISDLLEVVELEAEVLELTSPIEGHGAGVVLESQLDKSKGALATLLVQKGRLNVGDIVVSGTTKGKIKTLTNSLGDLVKIAGPSTPVEALGLEECVTAGEQFFVAESEKQARALIDQRIAFEKEISNKEVMTSDNAFDLLNQEKINKLRLIIKSDVTGTNEAIINSLLKLGNEEVQIDIVNSGVGGISESDVNLALTTESQILGFNVRSDNKARDLAESKGVQIDFYSVIYDLIEDSKRRLSGLLEPIFSEKILGLAEVKEVFKSPKFGLVAGCIVNDGYVKREKPVRVLRDNVVIHEGELDSLRRFKDDVQEVQSGTECGIGIKNYLDIKTGDVIENFEQKEEKRSL